MKTIKMIISGTVQGVFFRYFIKKEADALGLKGFARNLSDGKVEVFVEGRDETVNDMIARCRKGPANSNIKSLEYEESKHQGFKDFKIIKT